MKYKILFVDDETANLRLLERLFRANYEILTAVSAEEAMKLLEVHDVALIVSDQRMPLVNGSEFLKLAAELRPQTVRIMLTGYTDVNDLVDAINSGVVYKYITKPWVNEELQQTVKRALQHYETTKAQRQLQQRCERLQSQLAATKDSFVEITLKMLDLKVPGSSEHARRTAVLASSIGECFGMEWEERNTLSLAARLHDVTHFCTQNGVNANLVPETPEDIETASRNYAVGIEMFEKIPALEEAAGLLRFHYERFDGKGSPVGFIGAQIPVGARILAVAEAYDELRHPRGQSAEMSHEDTIRMLTWEAGKRFDPDVIGLLGNVCPETEKAEHLVVA